MIDKLLSFSIKHRWLVLIAAVALGGLGVYNYQRLPIDAVPDITNVQVQVNSSTPGYSPLESEQRVTFPIETAMAGIPKVEYTRSLSRYATRRSRRWSPAWSRRCFCGGSAMPRSPLCLRC